MEARGSLVVSPFAGDESALQSSISQAFRIAPLCKLHRETRTDYGFSSESVPNTFCFLPFVSSANCVQDHSAIYIAVHNTGPVPVLSSVLSSPRSVFRPRSVFPNCPFRMESPERIDVRSCPKRESLVEPDPVGNFRDHSRNPPDAIPYRMQTQKNSSRTHRGIQNDRHDGFYVIGQEN